MGRYCAHFIDEKTEATEVKDLFKANEQGSQDPALSWVTSCHVQIISIVPSMQEEG